MLTKTTRNAGRLALTLLATPFFTEAGTQQPVFSGAEIMFNPITVRPQKQVLDWVLQNAGAWPAMRDAVDKRIIREVKSRTGKIINSQTTEVGGMPEIAENKRRLEPPKDVEAFAGWLQSYTEATEKGN